MAIENFNVRHSLVSRSTLGPNMVGPGKSFRVNVPSRLENIILRLALQI